MSGQTVVPSYRSKDKSVSLYLEDCINVMSKMKDGSVDLTVTSPPYDNLRTYKDSLEWNEEVWKLIIQHLYQVTKEGGVVVWVVGDATIKGSETGTSFKQALYAIECGFNLHDTMIWRKTNPPPQTKAGRRYTASHEYVFVLSKGKPSTFNCIMQPCKMAGAITNNRTQLTAEGSIREDRVKARRGKTVNKEKPLQSVCDYPNTGSRKHPAAFPEQLVNDHILSWSNEGDVVFDPFLGSGTTGKIALLNNRKFIGCEKVPEYFEIARNRIEEQISSNDTRQLDNKIQWRDGGGTA